MTTQTGITLETLRRRERDAAAAVKERKCN